MTTQLRLVRAVIDPAALFADPAAARPWMDLLLVAALITGAATYVFGNSEAGRAAMREQRTATIERMRGRVADAQLAALEQSPLAYGMTARSTAVAKAIGIITGTLLWAAAVHLLFSVVLLRGEIGFSAVMAAFSQGAIVWMIGELFLVALAWASGQPRAAASPVELLPFVDWPAPATFGGSVLSRIDLFDLWWIPVVSLGLAAVYGVSAWSVAGFIAAAKIVLLLTFALVWRAPATGAGAPTFRH